MKVNILIVTHGNLGKEIYKTAAEIMGKRDNVEVLGIDRAQSVDQIIGKLKDMVDNMLAEGEILIFTDMLGGTPTNISLPFLKNDSIEIVTGINLPQLITALHKKDEVKEVKRLAQIVWEAGKKSLVNCRSHVDG